MKTIYARAGIVATCALIDGCSDPDYQSASADGLVGVQRLAVTAVEPYLTPSVDGVSTEAILTAGEAAANGYRMVGTPDGLGAYKHGNQFTVLMNHELPNTVGAVRAHGSRGAFVSKWTIDKQSLEVLTGEDLTPSAASVHTWNGTEYVQGTTAWNRLCSADLAAAKAVRHGNRGTHERIYFNGEETGEGRAWARIESGDDAGEAWELPRLGKISFENVLLSPASKGLTVAGLPDDAPGGRSEMSIYVGTKQSTGNTIERIGLTNGKLYGVAVEVDGIPITAENNSYGFGDATSGYIGQARFRLVALGNAGDVSNLTGAQLQADQVAKGVLAFQRIEDGSWDPRGGKGDDFYFATTGSASLKSRLFRLSFDCLRNPETGGVIDIVLTGDEGQKQFDNMTIDGLGRVLLEEDPGNDARLSKIWLYGIETGEFVEVAHHTALYFDPASPEFISTDEEGSGIVDAQAIFGQGWFLTNVMVAKASTDPEIVSGGQLLRMYVHPSIGRTGL